VPTQVKAKTLKFDRITQDSANSPFGARTSDTACLPGEKKFAEAEPLIILGYESIAARDAKFTPRGKPRLTDAADRAVKLCESWGKKDKATEWRATLAKLADERKHQPRGRGDSRSRTALIRDRLRPPLWCRTPFELGLPD